MKYVLGIFLSVVALTSATLQNSIDLANNHNATSFAKFVDAAGLTDILREQGMYCFRMSECRIDRNNWLGLGLWWLTPLSTILQLYRGG
jgi:hypothetical protein